MKKLFLVPLIVVLVVGLVLGGCAKSSPAPTLASTPATAPTSAPAPTTAPTPAKIKLIFATYSAEKGFVSAGLRAFGAALEQKTNGQVTVEYSYSQALGTIPEYYDVLVRGIADVVHYSPYQTTGLFPLSEVGTLPFVVPTAEIASKAFNQVYRAGLLDKKFYEGTKTLFVCGDQGSNLRTVNKPVTTLADIKGVKIMIPGGMITSSRVSAMGAVPVVVTGPDVYPALQKGTVEGQLTGWCPMPQFKWCEVNHYATEPLIGGSPWAIGMNLDSYNKLPKNIQKIIDEMAQSDEYMLAAAQDLDRLNQVARDCFISKGGKITQWEPSALEELGAKTAPVWQKWITDNEAKGLQATKLVDAYYSALEQLGVKNPAIGYTPKR
jgi:TRAP-type C4-dicarboxylate transport system substrate-binding protein